jgi:archaellum component FlaD/FlaE
MRGKRKAPAPAQSKEPTDDGASSDFMTIKSGLRKFLRVTGEERERFLAAIEDTVKAMTQLSYELMEYSNLYILSCMEARRRPVDEFGKNTFFYSLSRSLSTLREETVPCQDKFMERIRKKYFRMRGDCPLANRDYKGHNVSYVATMLATNCMNHVVTNLHRRLTAYVKGKLGKCMPTKTPRRHLKNMAKEIVRDIGLPVPVLDTLNLPRRVGALVEQLRKLTRGVQVPSGTNRLSNACVQRNWQQWLPILYSIARDPDYKGREFALLPHCNTAAKHIVVDRKSTPVHLCRLAKLPLWEDGEQAHFELFNVHRLRKKQRDMYAYFLRTDGISVSITLRRHRAMRTSASGSASSSGSTSASGSASSASASAGSCDEGADSDDSMEAEEAKEAKEAKEAEAEEEQEQEAEEAKEAKEAEAEEEQEEQEAEEAEANVVFGLDPGRRHLFYASSSDQRDASRVRCSNRKYRELCGVKKRQDKLKRWLAEKELKQYLDEMPSCKVITTKLLEKHIRYSFLRLTEVLDFYCAAHYRKLRQDSFYQKTRAMNTLAKSITGAMNTLAKSIPGDHPDRVTCTVAYGAARFPSCARGTAPIAARGFLRFLQLKCEVVMVDEYRTSKVCSACNGELKQMRRTVWDAKERKWRRRSIWAVKVCQDCNTVWDRDRNASINIRRIYRSIRDKGVRPRPFRPRAAVAAAAQQPHAASRRTLRSQPFSKLGGTGSSDHQRVASGRNTRTRRGPP